MKKNTPFLLLALLSISALSHSMDNSCPKKANEFGAAAAAAGAGAGAEQAKNASIITEFLELATSALSKLELPQNIPVSKAQLFEIAKLSKQALIDLEKHNEFTKTYIQNLDTLAASLIALRPQIQSLRDRNAEFMMHAKAVPSAITFIQKIEAVMQATENSQKDPDDMGVQALAAQVKKLEDEQKKREQKYQESIERILKKQADMMSRFFAKAKSDAEAATK